MIVDAVVVAGGRASRLGGARKDRGEISGETLLDRTIAALRAAAVRDIVVVGPDAPPGVRRTREDPPFAGPAAAVVAGVGALAGDADRVLLLACDMPGIGAALPALVAPTSAEGVIAVDRGRRQYLALALGGATLRACVAARPSWIGASVRDLVAPARLTDAAIPDGASDDIDTWDDVARHGVALDRPDLPREHA